MSADRPLRVINGLEQFHCHPLKSWITTRNCARQHFIAGLNETHSLVRFGNRKGLLTAPVACLGCATGAANLERHPEETELPQRLRKRA